MMALFGQKRDPKEQVREVHRKMRSEMMKIQRQVHGIQREEDKVKREIKTAAKRGDKEVCTILAKSIVQSRRTLKTIGKLQLSSTQINSIIMSMQHQLATLRMAGAIQQSADVMKSMQQLVRVPEIMQTMREMSREMTRIGIMEEIIEETMSSLEPENMEEQAQEEVDRILWEVTAGELGKAPSAVRDSLGEQKEKVAQAEADAILAELEASKS